MKDRTTSQELRAVHAARWKGPFVRGDVIDEKYRIDGMLGAGGMSIVYLAHDLHLDREVAIKIVINEQWSPSLRREGQALAAVKHPGVINVYGMGRHLGQDYLVLERLRGRTLQARLETSHRRLTTDETVDLAIGICDALSAAHRAGLAHRDLKPDNVFVCGSRVVLLDFGLFVPECDAASIDQFAGSPEFMAPEIITRSVAPGSGPLVDLYALGILMFELLTGHTPFDSEHKEATFRRHLTERAPDLTDLRPDLPVALAELVASLLEKAPSDRLGSAEAALWQLCAIRGKAAGTGVRPYRVLVVDDDAAIAMVLRRSLKRALPQLVVEAESDSRQALIEIERECPDLVLMDVNMPEMNGVEMMMQLSALPTQRRPRVVGMSADVSDRDVAVLRTLGVVGFVPKDTAFIPHVASLVGDLRHH